MFDMCKQINTYLLTYLLQGGRAVQLLHARDFKSVHRIWGRSSTVSKAYGLGAKPPEAGEYLSNKYEIRMSPSISIIPSGAFLQPLKRIILQQLVDRRQVLSIVDRRLSIILNIQLGAQHDDNWV